MLKHWTECNDEGERIGKHSSTYMQNGGVIGQRNVLIGSEKNYTDAVVSVADMPQSDVVVQVPEEMGGARPVMVICADGIWIKGFDKYVGRLVSESVDSKTISAAIDKLAEEQKATHEFYEKRICDLIAAQIKRLIWTCFFFAGAGLIVGALL